MSISHRLHPVRARWLPLTSVLAAGRVALTAAAIAARTAAPLASVPSPPATDAANAPPSGPASQDVAGPARSGASDPRAHEIFRRVLRRHAALRDFEADFTQTPVSRATGQGEQETGVVSFLNPDLWRWEYRSPEKKLVIVRGRTAAVQIEGDEDVSRYDLGQGDGGSASVGSLIAGGDAVAKAFQASFEPPTKPTPPGSEVVLRLVPAEVSEQFDHVLLTVHPKTLAIVELHIVDPGGNGLRFSFGAFRANTGLRESAFAWPESPERAPRPPREKAPPPK